MTHIYTGWCCCTARPCVLKADHSLPCNVCWSRPIPVLLSSLTLGLCRSRSRTKSSQSSDKPQGQLGQNRMKNRKCTKIDLKLKQALLRNEENQNIVSIYLYILGCCTQQTYLVWDMLPLHSLLLWELSWSWSWFLLRSLRHTHSNRTRPQPHSRLDIQEKCQMQLFSLKNGPTFATF